MVGFWTGHFEVGLLSFFILKAGDGCFWTQVLGSWPSQFLIPCLWSNFILTGWFMIACGRGLSSLGMITSHLERGHSAQLHPLWLIRHWLWNWRMRFWSCCFEDVAHHQPRWCVCDSIWACMLGVLDRFIWRCFFPRSWPSGRKGSFRHVFDGCDH